MKDLLSLCAVCCVLCAVVCSVAVRGILIHVLTLLLRLLLPLLLRLLLRIMGSLPSRRASAGKGRGSESTPSHTQWSRHGRGGCFRGGWSL